MAASTIDEYIDGLDETMGSVSRSLQAHLDAGLPGTTGLMWHGHPVWMREKTPIAGFKAYPKYVTLMFWRGQSIADESGTLSASGSSEMANVKILSEADIDDTVLDDWLRRLSELDR